MEELNHHGIKGMKWGVRRTPEQLGHKKFKKKVRAAMDKAQVKLDEHKKRRAEEAEVRKAERAKQAEVRKAELAARKEQELAEQKRKAELEARRNRKVSDMDDDELAKAYERLKMEDSYSELLAKRIQREGVDVKTWLKEQAVKSARSFGEQAFTHLTSMAISKLTGLKTGSDDEDYESYKSLDSSKASTKELKKAKDWYDARSNFESARRKSGDVKGDSNRETRYEGRKLSEMTDAEIKKLSTRLESEANIKKRLGELRGNDEPQETPKKYKLKK